MWSVHYTLRFWSLTFYGEGNVYSHFVFPTQLFTVVHSGVCSGTFTLYFISTCGRFSGIYCPSVLAYIW